MIDEADLECHGFEWVENYTWISDDPAWETAYVDRAVRMVRRDFNHPSIIMWSLGNESAFGCNFVKSAEAVRTMDPSRLVHYEGDFEAEAADVYSTMYTWLDKLEEIGRGEKGNQKPHVMCEYGHSMGNGAGCLKAYQDLFRKYKRLQGGFIWEWYDHGFLTKDEEGRRQLRRFPQQREFLYRRPSDAGPHAVAGACRVPAGDCPGGNPEEDGQRARDSFKKLV